MHRQVASLFVAGFMVMIVAAGCRSGAPIYNVVDAPIVTSVGQERSLADVERPLSKRVNSSIGPWSKLSRV